MTSESSRHWLDYLPLAIILIISLTADAALNWRLGGEMALWMHCSLGFFLLFFATLKLFDLPGFASTFSQYDLLAKRYRVYGYAYPFIELLLSLLFLSGFIPVLTYLVTVAFLCFGAYGVFLSLREGVTLNCACMGTILNVPLSTITLIENIGMSSMALVLLVSLFI